MNPQPLISVRDVEASSHWHQITEKYGSAPDGYVVVVAGAYGDLGSLPKK